MKKFYITIFLSYSFIAINGPCFSGEEEKSGQIIPHAKSLPSLPHINDPLTYYQPNQESENELKRLSEINTMAKMNYDQNPNKQNRYQLTKALYDLTSYNYEVDKAENLETRILRHAYNSQIPLKHLSDSQLQFFLNERASNVEELDLLLRQQLIDSFKIDLELDNVLGQFPQTISEEWLKHNPSLASQLISLKGKKAEYEKKLPVLQGLNEELDRSVKVFTENVKKRLEELNN